MRQDRFGMTLGLLIACAALLSPPSAQGEEETLYAQMGGEETLREVVRHFSDLVLEDPRINFTFANADMDAFRRKIYEQFCELTGGPCTYTGVDMKESHKELQVDNMQFNAIAEDLYVAMERAGVPYRLQNRLMVLLAPMQRDIVTK
ncbi:MAG: group I truncated hemoglobin [Steroidobacteraceae bacterium]